MECKGYNCKSIDGINHSDECVLEHNSEIHRGAGNDHPEIRYSAYTGNSIGDSYSDVERAAWWEGFIAREDT